MSKAAARFTSPLSLSAFLTGIAALIASNAIAAVEDAEPASKAPAAPFTGDRRPGILEEPSDIPTGENARLYDFLRDSMDDESVATGPKGELTEERYENAPTEEL